MRKVLLVVYVSLLTMACGGGGGGSNPPSSPPVISVTISPSATTIIDAGQTVKFTAIVLNDSDAKGVSWSCSDPGASGTPCGTFTAVTITSATYNAPASVAANASFTVTATSLADGTKARSATVGVSPALQLTTTSLAGATVNSAYSATLQASGGVEPLTWSLSSGSLPNGLTLQPNSGVLSGTPTAAGSFTFTAAVKDSSATPMTQTRSLNLQVISALALTITTSQLTNASPNTNYTATLHATGGVPPMTWSLASGALPTGVVLGSAGVISGDPTISGDFTFVVQVSDSDSTQPGGPSTAQAQLTLTVVTPIEIGTTVLPFGNQGVAYLAPIAASGGTAPYTWKVIVGSLGPDMALQAASGTISGDPQAAGTYSFTLQVTDSSPTPQTATQAYSLVIGPAGPLMITTDALLDGTVDAPYQAMIAVTGGVPPYHWSIESGALPSSTTLSASTGAITGTPSLTGTYTFTVEVVDSSPTPQSQTQALSLAVNNSAEACPSSGNNSALNGPYAFSLSGFNNIGFITVVGSFTADGTGRVTGGEADASGVLGAQHGMISASASSYSVGSNNLGCATITTTFGSFVTHFVLGSFSSNAATTGTVIEWDTPSSSAYVATGKLLRQDTASFAAGPSGGYIFRTVGWDPGDRGGREVCVGLLTIESNTFSAMEEDCNDASNIVSTAIPDVAGTVSALDANGRGTGIAPLGTANANVVFYAVSSSELLMVTADPAPFASGEWVQQSPPAGGTGFAQNSLKGNMVFYLNGLSLGGTASAVSVETGVADGTSALSLTFYEDRAGTMQSSATLTCAYSVEPSGRVYLDSSSDGCGGNAPVLYLSAVNTGFLMSAAPGVDTGAFEPQTAGPFTATSLQGNFTGGTIEIVNQNAQAELEPVAPNGGGSIAGITEISSTRVQADASTFPASAYFVNANGTISLGTPGSAVDGIIISPTKFVLFSPSTVATSLPTLLVMQQ